MQDTSRKRVSRALMLYQLCIVGFTAASCGKDEVTGTERVASVELSPAATTVSVGSVTTLTAEPRDESGNPVVGQSVHWSSSDTTVAVVVNGVVTARSVGEAQIAATVQGVSAIATILVSSSPPAAQPEVARVAISPDAALVRASGSMQFRRVQLTAVAYDQANRVVSGRSFTWSSSDPSKATVTSDGLVTGEKSGSVTITATTAGKSASSSIVVVK